MRSLAAVPLLLFAACASLQYDLAGVPFPVQATPAPAGATAEPFVATGKAVLWVHGLFGDSQPDVAALLQEAAGPCAGVASFRATASASFHDWFLTHLTLGLVRIKTVTITGERLRT